MQGHFKIKVIECSTKKILQLVEKENTICKGMYLKIANLLGGDTYGYLRYVQFGLGNLTATVIDEQLQSPLSFYVNAGNISNVNEVPTMAYDEVSFTATLGSTQANGYTIREAGVLSSDLYLLARATFGGLLKTKDKEFHVEWSFKMQPTNE